MSDKKKIEAETGQEKRQTKKNADFSSFLARKKQMRLEKAKKDAEDLAKRSVRITSD
ncbi:MAG: hypothetical protein ACFE95_08420 [Candidatus Hodarchaeota archaeon]